MSALEDAVGRWPAGSVLFTAAAVPASRHLGRRDTRGDGRAEAVVRLPAIAFADDAVGIHTGSEALARRVRPEAPATDPLDPHTAAVLSAALHEAGSPLDRPDLR